MRKRNKFNMSHVNSLSCKMGYIVPIMVQEALPGDTWQGDNKLLTRLAPLMAPVMHRLRCDVATFFVPNRILWDNWEDFITGGPDGNNSSVPPTISISPAVGTLADYFGLPLTSGSLSVSALPFRAYNLIYNDYFRDQDLQSEVAISTADGVDTTTSTALLKANWAKDYFTTARPWPQKGDTVNIPLGDTAPVVGSQSPITTYVKDNQGFIGGLRFGDSAYGDWNPNFLNAQAIGGSSGNHPVSNSVVHFHGKTGLVTDLSAASTINIDELRQAFAIQRWQEKRSLFGSRYEDLLHFWGLRTQDSRLQQPELISVRNSLIQFSEVLQTSKDTDGGVGDLYGHGIGAMRSGKWRYYCFEHGWLMSFMIVRPQAVYTQGLERMWTRSTRYDYWNPEFQHIGQQEILNQEVYADGSDKDKQVFGYQNRYDEYRRGKNHVTGEFRTTLDYWNMARVFDNRPALNSEFITSNPTDRIFQLSSSLSDQLYVMVQNDLLAKRLMSRNGNPI